ncbi:MAG TPA: tetratricopeptide repeat protein [Pyrinomonadaceae bacterium]|jgi:tetratricopeptide (TPR) repeat protein|nr:tetratricopeptide repeat protein [Pyrinomonadaceae bacterium]
MRSIVEPILLTLSALLGLGAMVYFIMHFATGVIGLPMTYWLVPVFGAAGGAVGGVLRNENRLILPRIEGPDKVILGVIGDISVGLGGACVIVFLFGNTLRINQTDALSNVLLISMSFIAGAVGKQLIQMASSKFLAEAKEAGKAAGEQAAEQKVKEDLTPVALVAYEETTTRLNNEGKFSRALEIIERILKYDPDNIYAYVEKGRALNGSGKIQEALATVELGLRIRPKDQRLLYNRACYMARLKMSSEKILTDLKTVCEAVPQYCELARTDPDLDEIRDLQQFNELMLLALDNALGKRPADAPETPLLLYSRACYRARLKMNNDEILADLKKAFVAKSDLKERALNELDLGPLRDIEVFKKLLSKTA